MNKVRILDYELTKPDKIRQSRTQCPFERKSEDISELVETFKYNLDHIITVGSLGCRRCEFFIMQDDLQQKILCSNPNKKTLKKSNNIVRVNVSVTT